MPAGDAHRAWFPEMLAELERFWDCQIPWSLMIEFCRRMTEFRDEIKQVKGVKPVRLNCPHCGGKHTMSLPAISIRSALFALKKLSLVSEAEFKTLDRSWTRYRNEKNLDAYGEYKQIDNRKPPHSNTCVAEIPPRQRLT